MFICGSCGTTTKPGEKKTMVPVETREKTYVERRPTGPFGDRFMSVEVGHGEEIVKEISACESCAAPKPLDFDGKITRIR